MNKIPQNFTIKDDLLVLCLNNNITNNKPIEPPKRAIEKRVFSGILRLFLMAEYLSYPAMIKTAKFIIKKYSNKTSIGLKLKTKILF